MTDVLVVGWYNHSNLGDELFAQAFQYLFPDFNFTFTDHITQKNLENKDAIFFGGGSFLGEALETKVSLDALKAHCLFYIGVGSETNIHPAHQFLIPLARLVAIRTSANYDRMLALNPNTMIIPDLVYALPKDFQRAQHKPNSLLVIPNINVVPDWQSPHYKHAAWEYFKNELAQTLDHLIESKHSIDFFSMSSDGPQNDAHVAAEIINRMSNRKSTILASETSFEKVLSLFSSYQMIITQRYHGAILANIAKVPSITIHHHDKLKTTPNQHLPFYGITKNQLLEQIERKEAAFLPIECDIFESLKAKVLGAL
jgi:polysaccharide pyruvyl transferase WcaK-like protein